MAKTAYVYVGKESGHNFEIGKERFVWGWQSSVLDKAGGREIAESLLPGDVLVLGHRGPNPRQPEGSWAEGVLAEVLLAKVTSRLYESHRDVWPDKKYPFRVDIEFIEEKADCGAGELGAGAMECLRRSGCKQGAPVLEDGVQVVRRALAPPGGPTPSRVEEDLDVLLETRARREQKWLRGQKFGNASVLTCHLCGRTFPSRLVRAAHVKRRSHCTNEQRLDLNNIMAACTMGCDELFEHGYVHVDPTGRVAVGAAAAEHPDVLGAAKPLVGRFCAAFSEESEKFFEFHRGQFGVRA